MIFDKDDFKAYDADLWNAIAKEEERQQNNIELIASENVVSKAVIKLVQVVFISSAGIEVPFAIFS